MYMDTNNAFTTEKRFYERVKCEYSAIVRGSFQDGKKFEEYAIVTNLSACGAYLLLSRNIEVGQILSMKIAFPTGSLDLGSSKLAATGLVVRTEIQSESVLGIAIEFQNYRFL